MDVPLLPIVDSTHDQYRRYIDMPSLMVGKFNKPQSIRKDMEPWTHFNQLILQQYTEILT